MSDNINVYTIRRKKVERPGWNLNPSPELDRRFYKEKIKVEKDTLLTYLSLREIEGITKEWLGATRSYLTHYLDYVDWEIYQDKTLEYLKHHLKNNSLTYYRKKAHQIRRFLTYLNIGWANDIRVPAEPNYIPKRVTLDDIHTTLQYFKDHQYFTQIKAIVLLGATSGMRPHEMYQICPEDIDLENRIINVNHDPHNGQRTKTRRSRVSFFNKEARYALSEYLTYFEKDSYLKTLFSRSHVERCFRDAPIRIRDLRKFFSQEWDKRGGPTSIKKILMGHSLKNDVDLMHYNYQSEEDLKRIYDKVMGKNNMI